MEYHLTTPVTREDLAPLRAGDTVLLSGVVYTARDAAHQRMMELLEEINKLGVGPQGFGGKTTCLGLSIETMPTHVASLPVAVNVSCHVTRRASAAL